eukprot:541265-Rhodomonas_salina.1
MQREGEGGRGRGRREREGGKSVSVKEERSDATEHHDADHGAHASTAMARPAGAQIHRCDHLSLVMIR